MATAPIVTFKAGRCEQSGRKITSVPTPGYLYLHTEDGLLHFCWRPRSAPSTEPELDLIMFPGDGSFHPLLKEEGAENLHSPTNGRIYALKFSSSSQKHYFWMQSKSQHRDGSLSWFSLRDQKLGQIVDSLLQDEDIDVEQELEDIRRGGDDSGPNGDADAMEVDDELSRQESHTGGAGADATGGDPRDEGEASREGGADGGRAGSNDTNAIVQNFLNSLKGGAGGAPSQQGDKPFTTLPDLLNSSTTVPFIDGASSEEVDILCSFLPPELFLLAQESASDPSSADPEPSAAAGQAAIEALSSSQKKDILKRVMRSPQLQQSLGSLTVALRDGGLPMIGDALGLQVENGGRMRGTQMPLGGGDAVEKFVEGVRRTAEREEKDESATR